MQKIKIGHRANFRAKYKCFLQILFPVPEILRSINFRCTDFNTDLADACILVMACVDCARANLVPRAHVPFGQHQDTELWNNHFPETKILGLPASRRMRGLV